MTESFFTPAAEERLCQLRPDGKARMERLNVFIGIAHANPGKPLVVPPDIDDDLHEVLAARGEDGRGFERLPLNHVVTHLLNAEIGPSQGKRFDELEGPLARETRELLAANGFETGDAVYDQPACVCIIRAIAA